MGARLTRGSVVLHVKVCICMVRREVRHHGLHDSGTSGMATSTSICWTPCAPRPASTLPGPHQIALHPPIALPPAPAHICFASRVLCVSGAWSSKKRRVVFGYKPQGCKGPLWSLTVGPHAPFVYRQFCAKLSASSARPKTPRTERKGGVLQQCL